MPIHTRKDQFDAIVVGSGAGGGMSAYVLTQAGAKVLVLEAGQDWDNTRDSKMLEWPYQSPRRGASTKERPFGEFDACIGGWQIDGEPYVSAPGSHFDWWRARMLGGRTNHWGRISLRFGPDDFHREVARRPGGRLAHHLRRRGAVLRPGRRPDRRLREQGRAAQRPRRPLPAAAEAALLRAAGEECRRQAQRHLHPGAALDPHPLDPRPRRLPLLRAVQPRLLGERQLLLHQRALPAGPRHRQPHHPHPRDGARGDRRPRRQGHRGELRRQDDRQGRARHRAGRRAGGERAARPRASC